MAHPKGVGTAAVQSDVLGLSPALGATTIRAPLGGFEKGEQVR